MDISILLAVASLHLNGMNVNPNSYNQVNPGIGIEVNQFSVGCFENSDKRLSTFGAYSPFSGWFRPFLGAVSGYRLPVMPMAGVVIEPWHQKGPFLTVTPSNAGGGIVLGLGFKYKIN